MKILVTGANGFVGRAVCELLQSEGRAFRAAVRALPRQQGSVAVGDIGAQTDWRAALDGINCVIHLAGRAHVLNDPLSDPLAAYRAVNVAGSVALARQAADAGVRRLVYVSSIKACCEQTEGAAINEDVAAHPEDAYGRSKLEAEAALREVASATGLELVVVRPVMVTGPGAKGNLKLLARALERGVPLPLGGLSNRRSLVDVRCLAELLLLCAEHPAAAGETFFAAASEPVSTTQMVRSLAEGLGVKARLWSLPDAVLRGLGAVAGRRDAVRRLLTDLDVDAGKACRLLGWRHAATATESLRRVGESFRRVG